MKRKTFLASILVLPTVIKAFASNIAEEPEFDVKYIENVRKELAKQAQEFGNLRAGYQWKYSSETSDYRTTNRYAIGLYRNDKPIIRRMVVGRKKKAYKLLYEWGCRCAEETGYPKPPNPEYQKTIKFVNGSEITFKGTEDFEKLESAKSLF